MTRRGLIRVLLFGSVAAIATACGVKGPIEPPPSEAEGTGRFPRQYPQEERPLVKGSEPPLGSPDEETPVLGDTENPPSFPRE